MCGLGGGMCGEGVGLSMWGRCPGWGKGRGEDGG